jgi:hypothetical protein
MRWTKANPICPTETVEIVTPIAGAHIQIPEGFRVEAFATELNFPTGIAFRGSGDTFEVFVTEGGSALPGPCNKGPDIPQAQIKVFSANGALLRTLGAGQFSSSLVGIGIPTQAEGGDVAGMIFVTEGGTGEPNSGRISIVSDPEGVRTDFITGLPSANHTANQLVFKGGAIFWSVGSASNTAIQDTGGAPEHLRTPRQLV